MTSTLVLSAPDFSKSFVLECDVSGDGLGVVLVKHNHPTAFESRKFKSREKTKSMFDKIMLVIMHALVKWKQYLLGTKFLMKTNHSSLKYFFNSGKYFIRAAKMGKQNPCI